MLFSCLKSAGRLDKVLQVVSVRRVSSVKADTGRINSSNTFSIDSSELIFFFMYTNCCMLLDLDFVKML